MNLDMSAPSLPTTQFDDIVIGSSPLMLLQAGLLARAGRRVCLLERDGRLGGSWQTTQLDSGEDVEIACHLIEVFPGIYPLLEAASGVPFVPLQAQPIRIHPRGFQGPYFSRILMLASGARLAMGWAQAHLHLLLGRTTDRDQLINFQTKLRSYLRHQTPTFFQRPTMQGPKHGFVDFMDNLIARTSADGVDIRTHDVARLIRSEGGLWEVTDTQGNSLHAEHVHCTTSTNLRPVATGRLEATPQKFSHRHGIVVEINRSEVKISQTYVAFWKDTKVARISRIDMLDVRPYERFLVEFHDPNQDADTDWHSAVRSPMERAHIVASEGHYRVVGQVDCLFTTNVDQLPAGEIDINLWGYYSMGNLAAGLAAWRKSERIPPLVTSVAEE